MLLYNQNTKTYKIKIESTPDAYSRAFSGSAVDTWAGPVPRNRHGCFADASFRRFSPF
jgi:hypothetical protein